MKLVPGIGYLFVTKIEDAEKTEGGLYLPPIADTNDPDKLERGKVIACSDCNWVNGDVKELNIHNLTGKIVVYQALAGYPFTDPDDRSKIRIIQLTDVVAVEG